MTPIRPQGSMVKTVSRDRRDLLEKRGPNTWLWSSLFRGEPLGCHKPVRLECEGFMIAGRLLILVGWVALVTAGCNSLSPSQVSNTPARNETASQAATPCSAAPRFEETIDRLTSCLDADASVEAIEVTLRSWNRVDDEWGRVSQADVVPGGEQEIIISYYPERIALNTPQGKFAVLKRDRGQWLVLYDEIIEVDGNSHWRAEVAGITDVTGDGYDDILVRLIFASRHSGFRSVALLTAHPNEEDSAVHVAFSREEAHFDTVYDFRTIDGDRPKAIQSVERFDHYHIITRTFAFEGGSFELVEEVRFPQKAADIPPPYRLGYDPDSDWHVYQCDEQDELGNFRSRICGMNSDGSQQRLIARNLVSSILVSPDGRWLVFAASPEHLSPPNCQNALYKMALAGEPSPLIPSGALRICAVHNLEWQSAGDKTWVAFRNWNGSGPSNEFDSMPSYRVDFEDGTLKQD